jgi:S1-C subfamily serine protease
MSLADDLLPPCTVRIGVRKMHSGSGFFVTPRLIATCAHVVPSSSDPRKPADASELTVVGLDGKSHEAEVKEFDADVDLAFLRVSSTASHPCVLLDPAPIISRDPMYTFAYPEGHTEGVPSTLEAEGRTGAHRWIFKGDQIRPGMSGAPLLNLRTGGVSGVINRTKGKNTDFGGYAIPISNLLKLGKTVRSANQNYHERSP